MAAKLLDQIQAGKQTLDQLLADAESQIQSLNRADRAFLHALVYGVLRWQARLDWVIDHLALRPGKKIDPLVRIILRLGLFQIQFMDRIPASAAVNTSVELAKQNRRKWAAGFVNGVLRSAIDRGSSVPWPDRDNDPVAYLSVYHSFPKWLVSRWIQQWGADQAALLCDEINTIPRITLRANIIRVSRERLLQSVQKEAEAAVLTPHSPEGISVSSPRRPLAQWKAYENGWFQVQSEASQCVAHLLRPAPGHLVWDACAGLGTKTAHLAQIMKNQGHIRATDLSAAKLSKLKYDMRRLGVSIVETTEMDLTRRVKGFEPEAFDRILLDAPCSGLGVLQKNPDGKWHCSLLKIQSNNRKQSRLLELTADYLKPGGLLVYAVCSIEPEENEQVVHGFLQKHPDFVIERPELRYVHDGDNLLTPEGFFKTLPHQHHLDGFFAAVLKRRDRQPRRKG